jgi:hypothetical protein
MGEAPSEPGTRHPSTQRERYEGEYHRDLLRTTSYTLQDGTSSPGIPTPRLSQRAFDLTRILNQRTPPSLTSPRRNADTPTRFPHPPLPQNSIALPGLPGV